MLVFDVEEPLVVSVIEASRPRGPSGASRTSALPNREIFLATFAEVGDLSGPEVVVFLADPLRSTADLTAAGVPGAPATFERTMKLGLAGTSAEVSTRWSAVAGPDHVRFSAEYPSAAIAFRPRFPGTDAYLDCGLARSAAVVYRSRPTETFALYDRTQGALIDLGHPDVKVRLRVRHHDPDIQAMFDDPANQLDTLFELDRVVRFQRP